VVLGESVEDNRFADAVTLLDWGFQQEARAHRSTSATPTAAPAVG
jgi:hypothetical protein